MTTPDLKGNESSYAPRVIRIGNVPAVKGKAVRLPKSPRFRKTAVPKVSARRRVFAGGRLVDFQIYHAAARSVQVEGTFHEGATQSIPLEHLGGGAWLARLLLAPGRYEYHYIVDGERRPDPLAAHVVVSELGMVNSVMVVP